MNSIIQNTFRLFPSNLHEFEVNFGSAFILFLFVSVVNGGSVLGMGHSSSSWPNWITIHFGSIHGGQRWTKSKIIFMAYVHITCMRGGLRLLFVLYFDLSETDFNDTNPPMIMKHKFAYGLYQRTPTLTRTHTHAYCT